ncbi:MAG: hypothetical protein KF764_21480 [Labilithrix sp.]|nr:hypothetical protein [Labilithrix sp.]MBX3223050.1 hypothetical protein [Labilithrix sp.]
MKRLAWANALFVVLGLPLTAHARADFDPAMGALRLPAGALKTLDFESLEGLAGVELTSWAESQGFPKLDRTKITSEAQLGDRFTAAADAIEGSRALRLGDGKGIAITDPALFAQVKDGRFEVSLWARADGAAPAVQVLYDRDADNVYGGRAQYALVRAIRTGRETTDGWAEYATGPLDGAVWGVPARAVVVLPTLYNNDKKASFLIDALEIRAVDGKPVAPLACTQANVDAVCGAEGDCMFGHCVSSTVTWGANPPPAHRAEIAERWIQFGTRFMGDRNAAKNGATILAPQARELAKTAPSSRQFYGGLNRLVNLLRDNHTSFGSPSNFTSFAPQVQYGSSSVMGACFGVVDKDLMGGGLGFAVFRAAAEPTSGKPLAVGDVITSIDGKDPKAWVDDVWPRYATTLPNDPKADWGGVAGDLSSLIAARASTVTLERCASASSCGAGERETITVDVGSIVYEVLTSPSSASSGERFACSQRFADSVDASATGGYGEDSVFTERGAGGETRVQFDGFIGQGTWQESMTRVFSSGASTVLMDARMGHGGYYTTVEHLFHLLRGTNEPMGVFSVGRGTYAMAESPTLLGRLSSCVGEGSFGGDFWGCYAGNANGFFATEASPPGAATKIAWLNTRDVSANDFMPRLLKGRTGFKIFAPHPTSGAFGAVLPLPSVASGWSGASIQIQDARFAPTIGEVGEARWESGHGVEPDEVVVQKLSDSLAGVDTIVTAATAWLATP